MRIYKPKKSELKQHGDIVGKKIKKGELEIVMKIPQFKCYSYKVDCGCDASMMQFESEIWDAVEKITGKFPDSTWLDIQIKTKKRKTKKEKTNQKIKGETIAEIIHLFNESYVGVEFPKINQAKISFFVEKALDDFETRLFYEKKLK